MDGWLRCALGDCDTANQLTEVLLGAELHLLDHASGRCAGHSCGPAAQTVARLTWADVVARQSIARSSSIVLLHRERDARRLASAYEFVLTLHRLQSCTHCD